MSRPRRNQRILAIDPGLRHVGIAVLQGQDLVYHEVLTMPYRRAPDAIRRNTRVLMRHLLDDFRPKVIAVEGNSIGGNRARSPLHEVVREIRRVGRRERILVVTKAASTVKKSLTGSGRASKYEVARACARCYPQLKAYLRQTAKWRTQYHANMFDAVALGLSLSLAVAPRGDSNQSHSLDSRHEPHFSHKFNGLSRS